MNHNDTTQTQPLRLQLPFTGGNVNVYLFLTPEPVLIDAGYNSPTAWHALQAALGERGLTAADLTRVIITHPHVDHYGLAAQIAQAGQAEIWMADVGVHWLRDFPRLWQRRIDYYRDTLLPGLGLAPATSQSYLQWMIDTLDAWEPMPAARIVSFPTSQLLEFGGLDWQVLHMPGHDSYLTCFYQLETQQLLSSDALIIPTATPVIDAPPPGEARTPALPQLVQSLDRLAALDVEMVYPGHGPPFGDHRTVIQAQQVRIQERVTECWRHLDTGVSTVAELFDRLYGARAAVVGLAGLWMVVGYLDLLVADGRATVEVQDGVWHYCATNHMPAHTSDG
jgi:glyoxylase-like metal-dependent hydrolase (beta-lactamase superfamily II)